jgi:hypothetical protein
MNFAIMRRSRYGNPVGSDGPLLAVFELSVGQLWTNPINSLAEPDITLVPLGVARPEVVSGVTEASKKAERFFKNKFESRDQH